MSFRYNPLKHIELMLEDDPPRGVVFTPRATVYCHSCGSERISLPLSATIQEAFDTARAHIENSHARTDKDFKGWSKY